MVYEPTVWSCDDELSAEKLNKLEEGVAQIMSDYVPTQWSCDDVITAEKLNKLEQAVAEASEGGSSDFSTAQVTISEVPQSLDWAGLALPTVVNGEVALGYALIPGEYQAILFRGVCQAEALNNNGGYGLTITVVDGDAEADANTALITGDCTIAIRSGNPTT